ncbi:MAG: glycosyltransferase [Methylotenera sp.]
MKILAITPVFFPQIGGIEAVVLELALRVNQLGVQMDVAHVSKNNLHMSTEDVKGVKVFRIPLHGNRFMGWAPALKDLARDYDLLHVHDPQLLAITANVRFSCGQVPAVLSTHGGFHHTAKHELFKTFYEKTLLRSSLCHYRRVLASSVGDEAYFREYSDRVVLCSNGVDVEKFSRVLPWQEKSTDRWIYWGRLSKNKRVDLVIDYAAEAIKVGHPVDLMICGRDFDNILDELKRKVYDLGLDGNVRFEPFLDDNALLKELDERGVYITASEHEGFGLSLIEAMAAGLIVVCRNIIPLNSFIKAGKSGFFLNFDGKGMDQSVLLNLLTLDDGRAESISNNAREGARKYDWHNAAQDFLRHYRECIATDLTKIH